MGAEIFGNKSGVVSDKSKLKTGERYLESCPTGTKWQDDKLKVINKNFTRLSCGRNNTQETDSDISASLNARKITKRGESRIEVFCAHVKDSCNKACPLKRLAKELEIPIDFISIDEYKEKLLEKNEGRPFLLENELKKIAA